MGGSKNRINKESLLKIKIVFAISLLPSSLTLGSQYHSAAVDFLQPWYQVQIP
jgi:hypothetical protein